MYIIQANIVTYLNFSMVVILVHKLIKLFILFNRLTSIEK